MIQNVPGNKATKVQSQVIPGLNDDKLKMYL